MSTHAPQPKAGKLRTLSLDRLQRGEFQPRRVIDGVGLKRLAESIREQGVLQPLCVRKLRQGKFEIVAGERRWHAARIAGLSKIPTIVRELSDEAALAIGLIENLHREDPNPVEQAKAMRRLVDELGMTHQDVAETIGRSSTYVGDLIRLLELPEAILEQVANGEIEPAQAVALLKSPVQEQEAVGGRSPGDAETISIRQQQDGRYQIAATFGTAQEVDRLIERLRSLSAELSPTPIRRWRRQSGSRFPERYGCNADGKARR